MPFFADIDDTEGDNGAHLHPVVNAFAFTKDHLERVVALNLVWSVQVVPLLIGLVWVQGWLWLRLVLMVASLISMAITAGGLYGVIYQMYQGEFLTKELVIDKYRELTRPGLRALLPLYALYGLCPVLIILGQISQVLSAQILTYYAALVVFACSIFWGPLFVEDPQKQSWQIGLRSFRLLWRYPVIMAGVGLMALMTLLFGIVSVGGFLLIAPSFIVVLQTCLYGDIATKESRRRSAHRRITLNKQASSHI
ncbi:hypothetical protein [Tengunoibacter tsumagoiensis]|uniref:DUF624 domain-containing protein n=1 Tax=Tengunoibacter tsumagoiensis TaxID=2014871 RepID=A0A401ZYZ2_9CHLR|nr:hypothetical protein [Tengunoibacter tsumagoiensis]GCE12074.1 hypothetical protein KTT_19330 [Tengunoibacter tsumagoiensis]